MSVSCVNQLCLDRMRVGMQLSVAGCNLATRQCPYNLTAMPLYTSLRIFHRNKIIEVVSNDWFACNRLEGKV